jgi:hypothetical protein
MSSLRLRLLGAPVVELAGRPLALPTRKLLGLLAYLALEGPTSRGKLAGLFWSEQDEATARGNLRRELNRLRHTPMATLLQTDRDLLQLGPVQTDVAAFRAHLQEGELEPALTLYRGPLLEGLELSGAAGFEEWLEQGSEALPYRGKAGGDAKALHFPGKRPHLKGHLPPDLLPPEEPGQKLHPLHRAVGEGLEGTGVQEVGPPALQVLPQPPPAGQVVGHRLPGLGKAIPAEGQEDHLRLGQGLGGHPPACLPRPRAQVAPPRGLHHLRHPVAPQIWGVQPLQEGHPGPPGRGWGQVGKPLPEVLHQGLSLGLPAQGLPQAPEVGKEVAQAGTLEDHAPGGLVEEAQGPAHLLRGGGADLADPLAHQKLWVQGLQDLLPDPVEGAPLPVGLPHPPVNLLLGKALGDEAFRDHGDS